MWIWQVLKEQYLVSVYGLKPHFQALLRTMVIVLAGLGVTANQVTITAILLSLLALPNSNNSAGHAGLLLFLLFLTQFNDVLQYVWGKLLGKTAVVPHISPSKTLAGLVGGVATTVLLA